MFRYEYVFLQSLRYKFYKTGVVILDSNLHTEATVKKKDVNVQVSFFLFLQNAFNTLGKYSRTSVARTLMARLPRLFRNRS